RDDDPAQAALDFVRRTLDALPHDRPASEFALRWLRDHAPPKGEVTLVHADFRTGNFMVTPEGLAGVLDWEFAHWGSRYEDLAWIAVRDWRFGNIALPIGGVCHRDAFYDAYERHAACGPLDRDALLYWEILGNLKWGLGCAFQGFRYQHQKRKDIELIAIARRAAEMEYEALRLIRGRS
ncbi:MAG: phosphotransferase, partial [Myxococcales bacterium]|nr:phosphotransferase [Myxococcales bacterium]